IGLTTEGVATCAGAVALGEAMASPALTARTAAATVGMASVCFKRLSPCEPIETRAVPSGPISAGRYFDVATNAGISGKIHHIAASGRSQLPRAVRPGSPAAGGSQATQCGADRILAAVEL